ncbi:PIN domain-containing protein [Paenibacillus silvae]|uniref:PIN domain-containing protein n=1 Tax=Paenibacillus silvae TaxID=1325358 RepID=UPI003CFBAA80
MLENMSKNFFKPKSLADIIRTADVVIDTNILLSAYQWKNVEFDRVLKTLTLISEEGKLKIPSQVIKEFFDQRSKRLKEIVESLEALRKTINNNNTQDLIKIVPMLNLLSSNESYIHAEIEFRKTQKEFRKKVDDLIISSKGLFNDDIVLDSLRPILEKDKVNIYTEEALESEAKDRLDKKIPPLTGGDSNKKENQYGDYYIWKDILSIQNNVVFVTTDSKEDWFHKTKENKLSPRRELIEEFYEVSGGRTICIVSLEEFLYEFNPKITSNLKENFTTEDKRLDWLLELTLRIYYKTYDFNLIKSEIVEKLFDLNIIDFDISEPYLVKYETGKEFVYLRVLNVSASVMDILTDKLIGTYRDGSILEKISEIENPYGNKYFEAED